MAYETGTATGHIDLLDKLHTFLTTDAALVAAGQEWDSILYQEVPGDAGQYEMIVMGPGLADDDEVYAGIRTYQNVGADYYNWHLKPMTGYDDELTFDQQPGVLIATSPKVPLFNSNITYWFVANGRRFVVVAKVSTIYTALYMGLILPYFPNTLLPYPYFCSGSCITEATRWSEQTNQHSIGLMQPYSAASTEANALVTPTTSARFFDGTWHGLFNVYPPSTTQWYQGTYKTIWPYAYLGISSRFITGTSSLIEPLQFHRTSDSDYALFPIIPNMKMPTGAVWGELDGCYYVTGFNNYSENIITAGGYDHLVVQNISRTGIDDYFALRLQETPE